MAEAERGPERGHPATLLESIGKARKILEAEIWVERKRTIIRKQKREDHWYRMDKS